MSSAAVPEAAVAAGKANVEHAVITMEMPQKPSSSSRARKVIPIAAIVACLLLVAAIILIPIAWTKSGVFKEEKPSTKEIQQQFDIWNAALQTGDPQKVAALYGPKAVLLPTVSNVPRNTHALIVDYFVSFLKLKPFGKIDQSFINVISPTEATNSGLYTFNVVKDGQPDIVKARYTFAYKKIDGKWKILEHHSSALPEQEMISETQVAALFDNWNAALQTLNPATVTAMYAKDAILLPTVSNLVRSNHTSIEDYFVYFLKLKPSGKIIEQHITIPSATLAVNSGVYVFNITRDGKPDNVTARYTYVYKKYGQDWLIQEHHSSAMPEQVMPTEKEIAGLFQLWNEALQTGKPAVVADRYAPDAILLPTLSNEVRTTRAGLLTYFKDFLKKKPVGTILESHIDVLSPTLAMDNGVYEFNFKALNTTAKARYSYVYAKIAGQWLIKEHHSSQMPEP